MSKFLDHLLYLYSKSLKRISKFIATKNLKQSMAGYHREKIVGGISSPLINCVQTWDAEDNMTSTGVATIWSS